MLILDNRETKLIELIKTINIPIPYTVESLPIGDIIIRTTNTINITSNYDNRNTYLYEIILERKCMTDMISSIKDGRYKEQKIRLLAELNKIGIENNNRRVKISYLLEGTNNDLRLPQDKNILIGSIISSIFRDNIPILRTTSLQDTLDLLIRLHERLQKDYLDFFPTSRIQNTTTEQSESNTSNTSNISNTGNTGNNSYLQSIKKNKKDNITPQLWNQLCLCNIPGISNAIAIKITEKYPSLKKLIDAYENCIDINQKEKLLADIIVSETEKQKRRLGDIISKRIFNFISNI
jgi:ERCC4-type nuclease